jgi:hypothetical protein
MTSTKQNLPSNIQNMHVLGMNEPEKETYRSVGEYKFFTAT